MSTKIVITPTSYAVRPEGEPLSHERVITVQIVDEGAGEFLKIVSEEDGSEIRVDPEEWEFLFEAGRRLIEANNLGDQ